jgi:hypothetical protein
MRQVQESYKAEYGVYIVFSVRRIPLYVLCNHTLGAGKKEKKTHFPTNLCFNRARDLRCRPDGCYVLIVSVLGPMSACHPL